MIPDILQFPVAALWGIGLFLLLFRRRIGFVGKLGAVLLYAFYVIWFRDQILIGYDGFRFQFGSSLFAALAAVWQETGRSLLLVWPLAVFFVFFAASDKVSSWLLKTMVVVTLFFWLFFFLFRSLPDGWQIQYQKMLPDKLEMPKLPKIDRLDTSL